jgi:hypothetical protein
MRRLAMKANWVKITPSARQSATAARSCRGGSTRSPHHRTRSANQRRGIQPTRGPCSPGFRRPANAKQVCGVTRLLWVRAPRSVRRRPNDRSIRPAVVARPCQVGRVPIDAMRGIRSAVIIPMRQQPGPMLIFRLTQDRRSRLDVGRHGGNPHSRPGAPVTAFRRHQEQLKNTRAVRGHTFNKTR